MSLLVSVNIKDNSISFIDLFSNKEIERWKMEKPYIGGVILPDGDTLLLYGKQSDTVDLYSLSKGKLINQWETGEGIVAAKVLKNGKEIAFADQNQDAVRFFTLDGEEKKSVRVSKSPLTTIEGAKEQKLYVISFNHKDLTVIDLHKTSVSEHFPIHPSAAVGALLREEKDEIWIGGHGEGSQTEKNIYIYNVHTGRLLRTIHAPLMPVNFLEVDDFTYVLSHGTNTLYKMNAKGHLEKQIKVGANPFVMETFKDDLLIAGYDSNDIHIVDKDNLTIKETIKVGKGPFTLILRERHGQ
ncbi:putative lipoprotein [Bacillus methanolicus PB1]|uniref:Putative lipoprotein n=1 Tax=Bacillus methanolicus PB1 TaxID=997296 RepID=I3DWA2_BACMT|nr:hypothetical protein [Bacillus methanolicus]EIJ78523.1 putative lipoprotein [Bacillus methanolicus PB1]